MNEFKEKDKDGRLLPEAISPAETAPEIVPQAETVPPTETVLEKKIEVSYELPDSLSQLMIGKAQMAEQLQVQVNLLREQLHCAVEGYLADKECPAGLPWRLTPDFKVVFFK